MALGFQFCVTNMYSFQGRIIQGSTGMIIMAKYWVIRGFDLVRSGLLDIVCHEAYDLK